MLTSEGCLTRRRRLWDAILAENLGEIPGGDIDWLMITDPRHVHYLCNMWVEPLSFSAGDNAILVLQRDGDAILFADNFVRRSAASDPCNVAEKIDAWYTHKTSVIDRNRALVRVMHESLAEFNARPGLIERCSASLSGFGNNASHAESSYDIGQTIRKLRRQKDPDEVDLLKQCMRATEAGHERAREVIQPGITEFDVYRAVQDAATHAAGRPVLVYGDFRATNTVTHKAGGLPTHYELQPGDLFILDYSVVIDCYRSDFTNTYAVTDASDDQARMALTCIEAIMSGEAALKPGTTGAQVYHAVSDILERDGHGVLKHHAGHGIGMSHPEPPILVSESTDTLLVGDVVTLEPGIYTEGVGGMRFEHNYLITETGFERLSDHVLGF